MGKTAFSGPVYGAKSLLWMAHRDNTLVTSSLTQNMAVTTVPAYEDWYITELKVYRGSTGSTNCTISLTNDIAGVTSTLGDVVLASSVASAGSTIITPTAGEYEGKQCPAGSTLTFTLANGGSTTVGSSDVTAWAYGYIRYIDSTRAV